MTTISYLAVPWFTTLFGAVLGHWLALRRRSRLVRRARALVGNVPNDGGSALGRALRPLTERLAGRPAWLVPELGLLPVGLLVGLLTHSAVPLLGAAVGVVPLRRWRLRRRSAAEGRRRATAVIDLCAALAAELRSGATPNQAIHAVVARTGPFLARGLGAEPGARLAAARYGADVPAALRLAAELPGGSGAAAIAACWQVTSDSGTGLAASLDQVAEALRAERSLAEEIAGELTGPRTTIAMLAALPLVGMGLGAALGAKPVQILLHTPAGLACLLSGAVLEAVGLAWTSRVVQAAEDAPQRCGVRDRPTPTSGPADRVTDPTGPAWSGCGISRTRHRSAAPRRIASVPRPRKGVPG